MNDFSHFSEQLEQNGYFIWPQLLPEALIDQHLNAFIEMTSRLSVPPDVGLSGYSREVKDEVWRAHYDFHQEYGPTQELLFHPRLVEFLAYHFGEAPVLRQPMTGLFTRRTQPHVDSLDLRISPVGAELRTWCALEDVHPDAGPVYLLPASHRLITANLEEVVFTERPELFDLLRSQMVETTFEEFYRVTRPLWDFVKLTKIPKAPEAIPLVPLLLKKGDVVVWRPDIVHGSCRCNQEGLTRAHMLADWSAQSASWYTPRAYFGARHDYRSPENAIPTTIHPTPHGLKIFQWERSAAYLSTFHQAVVVPNLSPELMV